jgi:hypothetical protein
VASAAEKEKEKEILNFQNFSLKPNISPKKMHVVTF